MRSVMVPPDYIVDIPSLDAEHGVMTTTNAAKHAPRAGRPWLAVYWRCCTVYSRVYRNVRADAYDGRCPRCGKSIHIGVGPEGTGARFFQAG